MARKTKDELTKNAIATEKATSGTVKKTSKTSKKVALKNDSKDTKTKSSASAKKSNTKNSKAEKKVSTKEPKTIKKSTSKTVKVDSISDSKINAKNTSIKKDKTQKTTTKKNTAKKDTVKKNTVKKATTKNISKTSDKKVADKKTSEKKAGTKKTVTKKVSAKKTTTKKSSTKKSSAKKSTKKVVSKDSKAKILPINPIEYYDLPYRYNQTVVKVLAQNPDRENFETKYGKMFFYNTKPVLVVHNLTTNYTFEIDIDDFANNWYIHVNNTKCKYVVELGRRSKYQGAQNIPVNYLNVAFSNVIEIPNDHILFFKENDKIYFKNIKTNKITEKIIKKKPHLNIVKDIYKNYNLSEDENRFDFKNPSSQNPTSTFL